MGVEWCHRRRGGWSGDMGGMGWSGVMGGMGVEWCHGRQRHGGGVVS